MIALADFNLVARHGGFGRAARATGRPKATLSRRVSDLESGLELRLFERGARTLKLTQEGSALFERTGFLLAELDEAAAAISSRGESPRGRLRISAPLLFSQTAMGKLASAFVLKFPEVKLEVTTEDRSVDMIEEGYDLVIRVNPDPDEALVGRILMRDRLVAVAGSGFNLPKNDVVVPTVVRSAGDLNSIWDVKARGRSKRIRTAPVLRLSSLIMVRDAVREGVGAALLPVSLVSNDLATGKLVHWGDVDGPQIVLWALYPSRRLLSARVSAFLDFLKEAFPSGKPEELSAFIT